MDKLVEQVNFNTCSDPEVTEFKTEDNKINAVLTLQEEIKE